MISLQSGVRPHWYLVTLTCLISGMGWGLSLWIVLCIMTVCKQITTRHACLTRTHTFVLPLQNALIVAKSHESPVKNNSPRPFSRPADLEGGNISDRLGKIKTSSENWKNRVGKYHVLFCVIVSIVYRRLIILSFLLFQNSPMRPTSPLRAGCPQPNRPSYRSSSRTRSNRPR